MNNLGRPYTLVMMLPTGIGAAQGGYAGDALPIARAWRGSCDRLITHPNVMNGAQSIGPYPIRLYVEGYGLDRFAGANGPSNLSIATVLALF